jgi:hypothetical protein
MRRLKNYVVLFFCILLLGCELLCQAGTGTCGMSREEAQKLLHPKTYGEYWVKSDVSKEKWRADWVACGGMSNGQYSGNAPSGSTTKIILDSQEVERQKLDVCMQSKGYEFTR